MEVSYHLLKGTKYLKYQSAKKLIERLEDVNTARDWKVYAASERRPEYIPENPAEVYAVHGWESYKAFLTWEYCYYHEAQAYAREAGIVDSKSWEKMVASGKAPSNLPRYPYTTYKDSHWNGWPNFLEKKPRRQDLLSFDEAKAYVIEHNIKTPDEWREHVLALDERIVPHSPSSHYSQRGWQGFDDFLGIEQVEPRRKKIVKDIPPRRRAVAFLIQLVKGKTIRYTALAWPYTTLSKKSAQTFKSKAAADTARIKFLESHVAYKPKTVAIVPRNQPLENE